MNAVQLHVHTAHVCDVLAHQDAILERLRNGTMPCDGAWPPEHVAVFQRRIASGRRRDRRPADRQSTPGE